MSVENRSSSALFKRAEQLKRWEESDTNRESGTPRNKSKKIQFSLECVFLAACASGDKEEVLKLLNVGADIDTSNVDGLSALHQACIDDNLDMVEFLVEHGADINKGDNEGWTPLHATASCGFLSIAKYLIEQGADIAAVNNDGELAVDIAECDVMEDLLHTVLKEKGIDLEEARNKEENVMLQHAKEWLNSDKYEDIPHEKTGATALHVAASKGYIKVMDTLIQAGADVNAQDFDGWTPLHAAAHWGQKEACEILVENFCDMDKKNYVGQTAFDVSEGEMVRLLEELRKKQNSLQKDRSDINAMANRKEPHSPKRRLSMNDKPSPVKEKDNISEKQSLGQLIMEEDVPPVDKVPKVELKIETESDDKRKIADENNDKNTHVNNDVKPKLRNVPETPAKVPNNSVPSSPSRSANENDDVHVPSWRKPTSFRNAIKPPRFEDEKLWSNTAASSESVAANDDEESNITLLRRTQSFEADDKFYRRYCELKAKIESGNTHPALIPPPTNNTGSLPTRSASLKERARKKLMNDEAPLLLTFASTPTCTTTSTGNAVPATAQEIVASTASGVPGYRNSTAQLVRSGNKNLANNVNLEQTTMSAPTTPIANKLSPGNIFKNFFKSFVPPVRDEESETQRKAHAKRVRETRRSTQGVTLEEIKSAEQLVKKKQQQQLQLASTQLNSSTPTSDQTQIPEQNVEPTSISVSATITTGTTTVPQTNKTTNERRPSWRLRIDNGCKFMLEDARRGDKDGEAVNENVTRWTTSQSSPNEATDTATVTLPLRKPNKLTEDGEPDKDDNQEAKSVPTQAANPRRKRPKRRSTGAVQFDNEEDNEKLNSAGDTNEIVDNESGNGDKSGRSSRLSSASSIADEELTNNNQCNASSPSENGELDYKKLYEETLVENERLREKLRKTEDDLTDCRLRLTDSSSSAANKNSLSEIEKREKRAMERKLSEMEEELKQIEQIKQENQRLKDENGALIRVISKLSK